VSSHSHIEIVNVSKSYFLGEREVPAVRDVSLKLERGDFVALCGSSGSGKTTLLNLIGCLAMPTKGQIFIAGQEVNRMPDRSLAKFRTDHLGFIFQNFNLLPVLTALENIEYALIKTKLSASERRKAAVKVLEEVGLGKCGDHRPDQLSGGQRQRVAIARAFVRKPDLIIADEPTANLDKGTASEILQLMAQLNTDTGTTVIMATHDQMAMSMARRRVSISDGKIQ
jgi:putative ABC transport system ATP-binding protein